MDYVKGGRIMAGENNLGVSVERINELANFAIEATGQSDSYFQGMCNGIEYMRATLTDTKPKYFDSNEKATPKLTVPEVTALALTKECEEAYNKGYADGIKAQQERKINAEKAIEILRADSISSYSGDEIISARNMAIKALEQESILDGVMVAIMDEIKSIWNPEIIVGMKRAVDIIDRYKSESERV